MKTIIAFFIKNKFILGGASVIFFSALVYWWSLTSTISSLEEQVQDKNNKLSQCEQLYQIEHAAVNELISVVEQENLRVQKTQKKLQEANERARHSVRQIVIEGNKRQVPAEDAEEMNAWFNELF